MTRRIRRIRLRTLLIVVMLVGVLLGGFKSLERRARSVRIQSQIRVWTSQREICGRNADLARSRGDLLNASQWDGQAAYAEGWRRKFEHMAAGGGWLDGPPIPKSP